jgi:hypothetical protein
MCIDVLHRVRVLARQVVPFLCSFTSLERAFFGCTKLNGSPCSVDMNNVYSSSSIHDGDLLNNVSAVFQVAALPTKLSIKGLFCSRT